MKSSWATSDCDLVSDQGYNHDDILEMTGFQLMYAVSLLDQQGNDLAELDKSTLA